MQSRAQHGLHPAEATSTTGIQVDSKDRIKRVPYKFSAGHTSNGQFTAQRDLFVVGTCNGKRDVRVEVRTQPELKGACA